MNDEGRMMTLRNDQRLALIRVALTEDGTGFTLSAADMDILTITPQGDQHKKGEHVYKFTIWSQATEGVDVGQGSSQWFSRFLGQSVTLVQLTSKLKARSTKVEGASGSFFDKSMPMRYQDAAPIHLVSQSSIDQINQTLAPGDEALFDNRNFRANVVVAAAGTDAGQAKLPAKQEEDWLFVQVNGTQYHHVRLCDRCVVPTIDSDKGVKVNSKVDTLKQFRSPE